MRYRDLRPSERELPFPDLPRAPPPTLPSALPGICRLLDGRQESEITLAQIEQEQFHATFRFELHSFLVAEGGSWNLQDRLTIVV